MSGTLRSAETARQDFPQADIRIIDTMTIAGCLGSLVLGANDLVQKDKSSTEVESYLRNMIPRSRTYFVVDTLEYLQKGGRIGSAKALLGTLLQVKPILQLKDGMAAPFEQERTKKRATARLIEITCEQVANGADAHLCVMHIDAQEEAEAVRAELKIRLDIPIIPIYLLPPAIVVHAGPKAIAVGFFTQ
jgi:DegV family protein with EDD domain